MPSIVFAHPAGLIHAYPKDAMFCLRARRARSSRDSAARVFDGAVADMSARPLRALLLLLPWRREDGWFGSEELEL